MVVQGKARKGNEVLGRVKGGIETSTRFDALLIADPEKEFSSREMVVEVGGTGGEPFYRSCIDEGNVLSSDQRTFLSTGFTISDVQAALGGINEDKTPVLEFFRNGKMLKVVNSTIVYLIAKKHNPDYVLRGGMVFAQLRSRHFDWEYLMEWQMKMKESASGTWEFCRKGVFGC
ncbi:hypothetical protein Dimus_028478 [Dionaea muscipula]